MEMLFKNKYLMALDRMIRAGTKAGGIPRAITLSPQEGANLVWEVNSLNNDSSLNEFNHHLIYSQKSNTIDIVKFALEGRARPTLEQVQAVVTAWKNKEVEFEYRRIPLLIKPNPPKKKK